NVVTKSGTNAIHGSTYEFFRNKDLNARGFFDTQKLDYLQNQFGATLGGPIKKDRTFFFATYEGDRIRRGSSSDTVTVPNALERPSTAQPFSDFSEAGNGAFGGALPDSWVLKNRPGRLGAPGLGRPLRVCPD